MLKPFYFDRSANIVETGFGKVRGAQYDGMYVFKGIPYAEAERFHAPHPPKNGTTSTTALSMDASARCCISCRPGATIC